MFCLQVNEWLNIGDQSPNRASRSQIVVSIAHVFQHRIDVIDMERTRPGKPKIYLLNPKTLHVVNQFYLLFYGRVSSAWTLQTVSESFIVKPQLMWVIRLVSINGIVNRIPVID